MMPAHDRAVLADELARTGRREQFHRSTSTVRSRLAGPALLIYYAPALIQHAKAEQCLDALRVLAAVFRAARILFPLGEFHMEETVIIRIDVLKVHTPRDIVAQSPWHLKRTSAEYAEAIFGEPNEEDCCSVIIEMPEIEETVPLETRGMPPLSIRLSCSSPDQ